MQECKKLPSWVTEGVGIISYDVPVDQRKVYNKIRSAMGKLAIQDTQSCYLFPWAHQGRVRDAIINADPHGRCRWKVRKFDNSENSQLQKDVHIGFKKMLTSTRGLLRKRLTAAEEKFLQGKLEMGDKTKADKYARAAAKRQLKEARRLAIMFEMTDIMEAAFRSLEKLVDLDLEYLDTPRDVKSQDKQLIFDMELP